MISVIITTVSCDSVFIGNDDNKPNERLPIASFILLIYFLCFNVAGSSAYEVLLDSEKRNIYDRYGEEGLKQHTASGGRGAGMNIQDIFSQLVS